MAEAYLLVILAIVVVSAVVIFKVVSSILKAALILAAVIAVIVALGGGLVVKDALGLKSGLQSSGGLVLFTSEDGSRLTAGAFLPKAGLNDSGFIPVSAAQLQSMNAKFENDSLDGVKGNTSLVLMAKESLLLSSLPDVIEVDGQKVKREAALAQLDRSPEKRAEVLIGAFSLKVSEDPGFLASSFKSGDLAVYPESPVFKAVKLLPEPVIRGILGKLLGGMEREA